MGRFESRIGISEETYLLLKAARKHAKHQEEKFDMPKEAFRAGNNTFSNDKLLKKALAIWVPEEYKNKVAGL